jgi:hypothetical protein
MMMAVTAKSLDVRFFDRARNEHYRFTAKANND